jgi:hypothetical protein
MCANLVTANLLCWIVLPVYLFQLLHSAWLARPHVPEEYKHLASVRPVLQTAEKKGRGSAAPIVLVVFLLLAVICFTFLVLPQLLD